MSGQQMLYRSTKSKIQLLWRQNDLGYPFTKNGSFTKRKKRERAKKNHYCWCWVDGVIPADWPMKSDNSEG